MEILGGGGGVQSERDRASLSVAVRARVDDGGELVDVLAPLQVHRCVGPRATYSSEAFDLIHEQVDGQ